MGDRIIIFRFLLRKELQMQAEKELTPRQQYLFSMQQFHESIKPKKGYCCLCHLTICAQEQTERTREGMAHTSCINSSNGGKEKPTKN